VCVFMYVCVCVYMLGMAGIGREKYIYIHAYKSTYIKH